METRAIIGRRTIVALITLYCIINSTPTNCQNRINHNDSVSYLRFISTIELQRDSIKKKMAASTFIDTSIIKSTENHLFKTYYNALIPKWLGTKWAFYGETQFPKVSSIACGHFVVTTLKHLGLRIENSHEMATNYSAYMVNSLCDTSFKVFKAADLITIVRRFPEDIWVVGLRSHSGLLVNYKGIIHFVHSSCTDPSMVVDELAEESSTFLGSSIFVSGPLFNNNCLVEKWIKGEEIKYCKKY